MTAPNDRPPAALRRFADERHWGITKFQGDGGVWYACRVFDIHGGVSIRTWPDQSGTTRNWSVSVVNTESQIFEHWGDPDSTIQEISFVEQTLAFINTLKAARTPDDARGLVTELNRKQIRLLSGVFNQPVSGPRTVVLERLVVAVCGPEYRISASQWRQQHA